MKNLFRNAIILIAVPALSTASMAHSVLENPMFAGFWAGFVHPLVGLDHLAALLAVGLWSALSARRAGLHMLYGPLAFANMLMFGAMLSLQGVNLPGIEPLIAASLLVTGLLVVTRAHLPPLVSTLLIGGFALFHGLAHGHELAHNTSAFQTLFGMLTATALLHATGLAIGWKLRSANVWLPRLAGSAVAAMGSVLLLQLS